MCLSPKTILNPKKQLNSLFDRSVLEVPCGTCKECFDTRRNGYFIRMYHEYLDCLQKGGFAYFLTLTYNPQSINHLPSGELCYRHDDVKNYFKLVRTHLFRDFGINSKELVRYFCCSEFGEDRHRPHYHIIFYVTPPINARTFIYIARSQWKHGFTKAGKYNNGIVQDVSAFSYVSKYCTKGDLDCETYQNLLSAVNRLDGYSENELKAFRYNCRPVIRSSKNFGLYLLSITDYNDLENGFIKMPDKKYTEKLYPLPLYYDRKLFYNLVEVDGSPCYRLNEAGFRMKLRRFENYKHSFHKSFDVVSATHFSPTTFNTVNKIYGTSFNSNTDMRQWFTRTISNDWTNLFNYSLVYNGYSSSSFGCHEDGIVTTAFDDFNIRLRLLVGLPVSSDELCSLNINSGSYNSDYPLALRIFRYLYSLCKEQSTKDFFHGENIRHRLTSLYYKTNVYNQLQNVPE